MEKLFILRDGRNIHNRAYTDKSTAETCCEFLNDYHNKNYSVYKVDLPFIGRSVCFIDVYCGFDYFFGKEETEIRDINLISDIYPCIDQAKESELWQRYLGYSRSEPSDYIITDTMIASKEYPWSDTPFTYGDSIQDKFNMQIRRIRVIRI